MSISLSERYSNLVDTKTRASLVLKDGVIFNNRYEGDAKAGAVKVRKSGAATVADYNKTNGVAMTEGTSEWVTITIDKDKAVNEIIDGYSAAAVPDGLVADRLDEAGYGIALSLDADGAAALVADGTVITDETALSSSTVYEKIVDARTALTKAGVPNDGMRYLLVSPDTYAMLLKRPDFIKPSDLGDTIQQTGAVGAIAGFNVYETSNFADVTTGTGANAHTYGIDFVAGHPNYATRVNEWAVGVHLQDLDGSGKYIGASAVQGRKVYAHKVTNPECILIHRTERE